MEINFNELKKKEVVDVSNGKNLGKISDLIIDIDSGLILKIVVPGKKGGFLNCDEFFIDYKCIEKIGDDAILYKKCRIKPDCPPSKCDCAFTMPCENSFEPPPRREFDDE